MTNSRTVLESIPENNRSMKSQEWNLTCLTNERDVERTLSVYRFVNEDKLGFHINIKHKPQPKHLTLIVISSVCDYVGIASPFVKSGRSILQTLCKEGMGWDDETPDNELSK